MIVIIRGLPGSGKSTEAEKICQEFKINHHYENDMFFLDKNGEYKFNSKKVKESYEWCKNKVEDVLKLKEDVVVSNNFVTKAEVEPYVELARKYNTSFYILEATGNFKSIHGIPEDVIKKMKDRWEQFDEKSFNELKAA